MSITPSFRSRLMAAINISFAFWTVAVGWGFDLVPDFILKRIQRNDLTPCLFVLGIVLSIPFVVTYTKVGLNSAEGEKPFPETKRRHKELRRVCPEWPFIWYGMFLNMVIVFISAAVIGKNFDPDLLIMASFIGPLSLTGGLWFLFVYHVAKELFAEELDIF